MPYNSQNNDALIKELKFALKSVRERQNSAKIYPRAGFAGQKAEVVEQLKIHSNLIGQQIWTKISNLSPLGGGTVRILIKTNVVGEKPQSPIVYCGENQCESVFIYSKMLRILKDHSTDDNSGEPCNKRNAKYEFIISCILITYCSRLYNISKCYCNIALYIK